MRQLQELPSQALFNAVVEQAVFQVSDAFFRIFEKLSAEAVYTSIRKRKDAAFKKAAIVLFAITPSL